MNEDLNSLISELNSYELEKPHRKVPDLLRDLQNDNLEQAFRSSLQITLDDPEFQTFSLRIKKIKEAQIIPDETRSLSMKELVQNEQSALDFETELEEIKREIATLTPIKEANVNFKLLADKQIAINSEIQEFEDEIEELVEQSELEQRNDKKRLEEELQEANNYVKACSQQIENDKQEIESLKNLIEELKQLQTKNYQKMNEVIQSEKHEITELQRELLFFKCEQRKVDNLIETQESVHKKLDEMQTQIVASSTRGTEAVEARDVSINDSNTLANPSIEVIENELSVLTDEIKQENIKTEMEGDISLELHDQFCISKSIETDD